MRLVDKPTIAPAHCAAIPFLGPTSETTRWIDTGSEMVGWDGRVYLSDVAVRQCMSLFGFPSPGEYEQAVAERDAIRAELEALKVETRQIRRELDAIDVLESADFTRRKKPGRPPKVPV